MANDMQYKVEYYQHAWIGQPAKGKTMRKDGGGGSFTCFIFSHLLNPLPKFCLKFNYIYNYISFVFDNYDVAAKCPGLFVFQTLQF